MSTDTVVVTEQADPGRPGFGVPPLAAVPDGLTEQLVQTARSQGVALTGPGGLLTGLTRQVLETALETEMAEHLGHDRGGTPGPGGDVRNGHSGKTVRTEIR